MNTRILLVDGSRGIYVPRAFVRNNSPAAWGLAVYDAGVLAEGPDNPNYWDVWDDVLAYASTTDAVGQRWYLLQDDGALFAILDKDN